MICVLIHQKSADLSKQQIIQVNKKDRRILGRLLDGDTVNGIKSPWDRSNQRAIGTEDNPNGPCCIQKKAKRISLKQFGVEIGDKKQLFLHQAAFAYEYGYLPLNDYDGVPPKIKAASKPQRKKKRRKISKQHKKKTRPRRSCRRDKAPASMLQSKKKKKKKTASQLPTTLVIAHSCGRWNCFVPKHMDIVPHADNLIQCRCHDDLRVQNNANCFSSTNKTYGLGRDCWDRHPGLRCHYNFSNGPADKAPNTWKKRKRKRSWV